MALNIYHRERNEAVFRRNRGELAADPDVQAGHLRARFAKISCRLDRAAWLRSLRAGLRRSAVVLLIPIAILGGSILAIAVTSPWPVLLTVRHLLAATNCNVARAVGLAPTHRGTPGYWAGLDADADGISCEP
jgi:hypothetical protein